LELWLETHQVVVLRVAATAGGDDRGDEDEHAKLMQRGLKRFHGSTFARVADSAWRDGHEIVGPGREGQTMESLSFGCSGLKASFPLPETLIRMEYERRSETLMGLRTGQILDGRFEVGTLIGHGGQGVVFNVRHLEWGRNLALKLPRPEVVQTKSSRDRYLKEAETWIRMGAHPNIVRCWFVHRVCNLPGLFLDLIAGGSLDDQMKQGKIERGDWGKIIEILLQVAEGLTHSHAMGVVHRDIKPENLLVRESGQIVLTDFGLVKAIGREAEPEFAEAAPQLPSHSGVTGHGQYVGTPRYGAPEQWVKEASIGPATDLYSAGVVFYELLCGRRPLMHRERLRTRLW